MGPYNQDAWRLVEEPVRDAAKKAVAEFVSKGDALPSAADFVGQMFVKTGSTGAGLYVATGTTTPGWKAVTLAS